MSQPVKLSDALVLDARMAAEAQERSIAGQVEFWAKLGQAVEPLLSGRQVLELKQKGKATPLSELVSSVEAPEGRARTKTYLESLPYPHYRQFPGKARVYIRTAADGTKTVGRFLNRAFVPVDTAGGLSTGTEAHSAQAQEDSALIERTA
jgi:rhodanese-related sulfurtransferase